MEGWGKKSKDTQSPKNLAMEGWGQCTTNCQQIVWASFWPGWTLSSIPFGSGHCPTSVCESFLVSTAYVFDGLWKQRNGILFNGNNVEYLLRLRRNINWSYTEFSVAKTERGITTELSELSDMQGRLPPDPGLIKLNMYASVVNGEVQLAIVA
ncbi:hypothetical protein TorRG33x02_148330 [Trema orientale]|uniref:Uncharacterized protein n=1 Tax=Trema orientale TaxID=63057 RepID=A0A2P5EUR5_TREOI|nr:hypothetical protein TorRG33x02_148330 [Trema orientale]